MPSGRRPSSGVMKDELPVHVLNPGGRDREILYADMPVRIPSAGHPPVNFHAYAACTGGGFFVDAARVPDGSFVVVLLRPRHLDRAEKCISGLCRRDCLVAVTLKECGLHQLAEGFFDSPRVERLRAIARVTDRFVAATEELVPFFHALGFRRGGCIPTPYPVGLVPYLESDSRAGILVGTREFRVPSRNHLLAIAAVAAVSPDLTVLCEEGGVGEKVIRACAPGSRIVRGPVPYAEYLSLMAGHRVVFQLDRSSVPGQVAGDALLAGAVCVGGDGAVDRLAFPRTCGWGRTVPELVGMARSLLESPDEWVRCRDESRENAVERLSFEVIAPRLRSLFVH